MKILTPRKLNSMLALLSAVLMLSCSSSEEYIEPPTEPEPPTEIEGEEKTYPEAWHDKMRTRPYPQIDNELIINPSPLIVPMNMKVSDSLQFELSQDPDFETSVTQSAMQAWCMYNPHRTLENGTWYWRYRQKSKDGKVTDWSKSYQFKVEGNADNFVTPAFAAIEKNIPTTHPRLYCFLNEVLPEAQDKVKSLVDYKAMINLANTEVDRDVDGMANPWANAGKTLKYTTLYLHTAYVMTKSERVASKDKTFAKQHANYKEKMLSVFRKLLSTPLPDSRLFASNFESTDIALCLIPIYDEFYEELTTTEREQVEKILMRLLRYYYPRQCTYEENHIFDNHFWQQNMRVLMQCAFLLCDKPAYRDEVLPIMEYYYELWTARAPSMGYNRDGGWQNGTKYFANNVETLYYVPKLFSHIAQSNFLLHPWFKKAGETIVYTWPPSSKSLGFGDGWEWYDTPQRQRVAYADFLARELGDAYAGWYAAQQPKSLRNDPELRLYRMANCQKNDYVSDFPDSHPKMMWLEDMGEVIAHSDVKNVDNDFAMSFRSSTFGSGSHTLADQNSFNVLYRGDYVYNSTGYYQNFSDKHNILSYRHSRAHNTILVDGIGQPFSTTGYGDITRAMDGDHIAYCLGDASHAYSGISNDDMWIDAFKAAGISQTPEFGFGATPLKKYRRHILMLYPDNIMLMYDELEATSPVRWDWLLHSQVAFDIDNDLKTLTTENATKGFVAQTRLFCNDAMTMSQTDEFFANPNSGITAKYPKQWHFTANIANQAATRVLAIMQVADSKTALKQISSHGDTFRIGNWIIEAKMAASGKAYLKVTNTTLENVSFEYSELGNSTLNDTVNGTVHKQTQTDHVNIKTRAIK